MLELQITSKILGWFYHRDYVIYLHLTVIRPAGEVRIRVPSQITVNDLLIGPHFCGRRYTADFNCLFNTFDIHQCSFYILPPFQSFHKPTFAPSYFYHFSTNRLNTYQNFFVYMLQSFPHRDKTLCFDLLQLRIIIFFTRRKNIKEMPVMFWIYKSEQFRKCNFGISKDITLLSYKPVWKMKTNWGQEKTSVFPVDLKRR